MEHIVISPGSRSAPLAYAIAALDKEQVLTSHVRIDERSAGFLALGIAKESCKPVGIVTTSGTAVGELLPAVMEAYHSGVPLIVLSADRPAQLRGSGSNQTTRQPRIFGHFVRAEADLQSYPSSAAEEETDAFRKALSVAFGRNQEWIQDGTVARGPVHLNLAFDTPLTPPRDSASLLEQWAHSLTSLEKSEDTVSPIHPRSLLLKTPSDLDTHRTVVIAGDGAGQIAQDFAQALNLPLLAEPSAGLRTAQNAVLAYRELADTELWESIEKVILFGHPTLSRPITALLAREDLERALYLSGAPTWFEEGRRSEKVFDDLVSLAYFAGRGDDGEGATPSWRAAWQDAGRQAYQNLMSFVENYRRTGTNESRAAGMSLALSAWEKARELNEVLLCGSSNLIRDLDLIAPWNQPELGYEQGIDVTSQEKPWKIPRILSSRGLAGIDGTISVGSGISLATTHSDGQAQPVRILCGDLTFLHDVSSLNIGPLEKKPQVSIDVLDDRGGGIFATLEHGSLAEEKGFTEAVQRYFTTPHIVDLSELAHAFGQHNGIRVNIHRLDEQEK